MVVGQLEIQLMASMARLNSDMEQAKRTVGGAVDKINNVLGLIGVGISGAALVGLTKDIANVAMANDRLNNSLKVSLGTTDAVAREMDFLRKTSDDLGLAFQSTADEYAKLAAASKGTALEGKQTREIFLGISQAATVLGLSAEQSSGALNAIQQMISKGKVSAEELRGQLGERLPGAFQMAARSIGVTTAELDKMLSAGKLTAEQLLPRLAIELQNTYGASSQQAAQGLSAQINRLNNSFLELKLAIANAGLVEFLNTSTRAITLLVGKISEGIAALKSFASTVRQIPVIGAGIGALFGEGVLGKISEQINAQKELNAVNAQSGAIMKEQLPPLMDLLSGNDKTAKAVKSAVSESERFMIALQKEADQLGKTSLEIRKMEAAKLGLSAKADPLIDRIYEETEANKKLQDQLSRAKQITDSVATEQEIYNKKLDELNRLKPYLTIETYNRALQKAQDELKGTVVATRSTTDQVSQLWIQTGRNIQTSLANSIFDFFNGGLDDMVRNVKNAVGRILSEFAALKLSQSIGLDRIFSVGGVGGTGAASGGSNALGIASTGFNAASLLRGGLGTTGLVGGGLQSLGSTLGFGRLAAFGGGFAGDAIGGLAAGGFTSGAASAASAGASFAAVAGPAIALAAVDMIGRVFAGNKKLGGAEMIPVLGGFLAGLFGHGPLKFRQQSLQGTASSEGFDGDITNVFRAKGGLLVGNKHKSVTEQFSLEQQTLFDNTLKGFYGSAHQFAENLGLSTDLVDNFTKEVQIKSEKGKTVTEEAITEMLDGIGNSLAQNVLPIVDTLRKAGEDAFATLTRLNTEFVSLVQSAQNLGASAAYAKELVSGLSIETRTAYVDAAGGPDALLELTAKFNQNFLTEAERMAPKIKLVEDGLTGLGIAANISKDAFGELIQTLVQSASDADKATALLLLRNQDLFLEVNSYKESLSANPADLLNDAFSSLKRSVDSERKRVTDNYNDALDSVNTRIQSITDSIGKLQALSGALKNTVEELRPLSRDEAKFQILSAINKAKLGGGLPDVADISQALDVLKSNNITGARSSFELAREQAKTANLVADLGGLTDKQLSVEERSLMQLQDQRLALETGFGEEMLRLDSLLEQGQKEIDTLNGLNTTILSLAAAIEQFNLRSAQAGGGSIGGMGTGGNPSITDQQIRDFVNTPGRTEMEIYNAARDNGVSFAQYALATGTKLDDLYKFANDRQLPIFHSGTSFVPRTGPAILERGERVIPKEQNKDLKKSIGNDEVLAELRKMNKTLDAVTQSGTALRTKQIA